MSSDSIERRRSLRHLLAVVAFCVLLTPLSALAQTINLQMRNVTVQEAITALNKSENYSVILNSDDVDLKKRVDVIAVNASIQKVLDQIFKGQDVSYSIDGRRIQVIRKKPQPKTDPVSPGKAIRGKVTDSQGEPLIGASLMFKGTNQGCLTDVNGEFELPSSISLPVTVTVSYIGYSDTELAITGNEPQPFTIVIDSSQNLLDEIVVVGYGTQKKSSLSGAVATVSGKVLNARPVVSAANALQGADPATNISFGTGSPEGSYSINIRGTLSLNSGSPLVLADGVEVSLSQINPNDIESVSILKDASSCAIYGTRASAGVVLITTKSGKRGDNALISYSGRVGWQMNTTSTDFISTGYDHVSVVNLFMNNSSDATHDIFQYTEANGGLQMLLDRRYDVTENPERPWTVVDEATGKYYYYGNFDWYGYIYRRVRPQTEHNVSIQGGSEKINYYASARYLYQKGMMRLADDTYTDYAFRAKLSVTPVKWLKYSANVSYDRSRYSYGGYYNYEQVFGALQSNVCAAWLPYNPDGTVVSYVNQLAKNSPMGGGRVGILTAGTSSNSRENEYLTITNSLVLTFTKGLYLTAAYDYRTRNRLYKYRSMPYEYSRTQGVIETVAATGATENMYQESNYGYKGHNLNVYGTYEHSWKNGHNFKVVAGGQYEYYRSTNLLVKNTDLTADALATFAVAAGTPTVEQDIEAYKTLGFFARANYDYKNKYILEASFRADGSSRFAPGQRWAYFPSGSVAWRISEEDFYAPARSVMNDAKIRFSAGSLGNQQVTNYAYIVQILTTTGSDSSSGFPSTSLDYTFDGEVKAPYAKVSNPISSDLTWETVTTYDAGIDLAFFDSRLTFTGDYYVRDTRNMLTTSLTLPSTYGASTPKANCANLRTNGWELMLGWNDTFKLAGRPFSYNVSATLGDYITTITKYHNPDGLLPNYNGYSTSAGNYYEGMRLGEIWGYRVDGLFRTDREAAAYEAAIDYSAVNSRIKSGNPDCGTYLRAGDPRFVDLNHDGVIGPGAGTLSDHGDMEIIGNSLPRYNYSFRLGFNWLGFDVSAFFQGVGHRDWYANTSSDSSKSASDFWGPYAFPVTSFISSDFMDNVWSETNRNAYFPRPRGYNAYSTGALGHVNDRYLVNLAYLRLKNFTFGYSLPEKLTMRAKISQVRFYFTGENLCYWSPVKKYTRTMDPEIAGTSGTNAAGTGVGYAFPKTYSIGVDIKF